MTIQPKAHVRRLLAFLTVVLAVLPCTAVADPDPDYREYAALLRGHVRGVQVDYAALKAKRAALDAVVNSFASVRADEERSWSRANRLAFWINAYNVFTLHAIVDHYPIAGSLADAPRASIRQIDGVWTKLRWNAAGRTVTLDDIEHAILRREIGEPLIHVAVNCASLSCPPLREEPYRGAVLDAQLQDAARRFLASPAGLQVDGTTVRVSSIFKWYGDDFTSQYSSRAPATGATDARTVRGLLTAFAPPSVQALLAERRTRIAFLDYDWSLNDTK